MLGTPIHGYPVSPNCLLSLLKVCMYMYVCTYIYGTTKTITLREYFCCKIPSLLHIFFLFFPAQHSLAQYKQDTLNTSRYRFKPLLQFQLWQLAIIWRRENDGPNKEPETELTKKLRSISGSKHVSSTGWTKRFAMLLQLSLQHNTTLSEASIRTLLQIDRIGRSTFLMAVFHSEDNHIT